MTAGDQDIDLQIPALGQPWDLGCMYDATTGKIVLGHKLWDDQDIMEKKKHKNTRSLATEVVTQDTIDERSNKFDLDVGMKLGFLGGLVKVEGSARYLDERFKAANQARVNFYYKAKTHAETLPMEILNDMAIKYPEIMDRGRATHVCVGIEYGGNAVFEFEREISHEEEQREVEGRLSVVIDSIPTIKIQGEGRVGIDEQTKAKTAKLRTKYVGDIHLNNVPTNFESAVKAYNELHEQLKVDTSVPVVVHLLPLTRIKPDAARLVKELDEDTISDLSELLAGLKIAEQKLTLMSEATREHALFPCLVDAISTAAAQVKTAHSRLRTTVQTIWPKVRRGDEGAFTELSTELDFYFDSPFEPIKLKKWIKQKEDLVSFISSFFHNVASDRVTVCKDNRDVLVMQTNKDVTHMLALEVQVGNETEDTYLKELGKSIKLLKQPTRVEHPEWCTQLQELQVTEDLKVLQRNFLNFVDANEDKGSPKFLLVAGSEAARHLPASTLTASITYYSKATSGTGNVKNYWPASPPTNVKVANVTDKSFVVTWTPPSHAEDITGYEVKFRKQTILDLAGNGDSENGTDMADGSFVANLLGSRVRIITEDEYDGAYGKVESLDSVTNKFVVGLEDSHTKVKVRLQQLGPDVRQHSWDTIQVPADLNGCLLDGLSPLETYEVCVRSLCMAGGSAPNVLNQPIKTARANEKELNYMVLGPTGVGKSTFITAFRNYLSYKSLEDAKKGGLLPVMPTAFTCIDKNGKEHKVEVEGMPAPSDGEALVVEDVSSANADGAASTQRCCSYLFSLPNSDVRVRIIDTPGIADPRGNLQDQKNCQHIFDFIGKYEKIHGILILLKPNDARLTTTFEYCILELLKHLHLSASRNIFFVMTNSRSTMYTMGDTIVPLRKLLNDLRTNPPHVNIQLQLEGPERTVFCLDSESFRFLAARERGISLPTTVTEQSFIDSWNISSDCCRELLAKVTRVEPHNTHETVSLNEARRQALALREPMVQAMTCIAENVDVMEHRKKDIQDTEATIDNLKKLLNVTKKVVKATPLKNPNTVCTHENCVEIDQDELGQNIQRFRTNCHEKCHIRTEVDKFPNPELQRCWAMRGNGVCTSSAKCAECGHGWEVHMHTRVRYEPKTIFVVDSSIERQLKEATDAKGAKQKLLRETEELLKEYKEEQEQLRKACSVFGSFLARNGISPINKAFERYIKCEIQRLERLLGRLNVARGDVDDITPKIEGLKAQLKLHEKEVEDLNKLMDDGLSENSNAVIDAERIMKLKGDLFKLKHFGKQIKELSDAFDAGTANMNVLEGAEVKVESPHSSRCGAPRGRGRSRRGGRNRSTPPEPSGHDSKKVYHAKKGFVLYEPKTWIGW